MQKCYVANPTQQKKQKIINSWKQTQHNKT